LRKKKGGFALSSARLAPIAASHWASVDYAFGREALCFLEPPFDQDYEYFKKIA
jgi:hypothetical protein